MKIKNRAVRLCSVLLLTLTLTAAIPLSACKSNKLYDYDLSEYISVPEYKNITLSEETVRELAEIQIYEYVWENKLMDDVTDGVIKKYDKAVVDYTSSFSVKEGETVTLPTKDVSVYIGKKAFVDGFEDALIGMAIGETKEFKLIYPEPEKEDSIIPDEGGGVEDELAGKEITYSVTLKSLQRPKPFTDDFCKEHTVYANEKEMMDSLTVDAIKTLVWQKIQSEATVIKYPEAEYDKYYAELLSIDESAEQLGMTRDAYISAGKDIFEPFGITPGISDSELASLSDEYARSTVKNDMILYFLARELNVPDSGSEYRKVKKAILKENGYKNEKEFDEFVGDNRLHHNVLSVLVLNALYEQVTLV